MIRPGSTNHRRPVLNLAMRRRKKILSGGEGVGERKKKFLLYKVSMFGGAYGDARMPNWPH